MPPRRPLPDLCLISVFKMLTPNEQLKASLMSLRCSILVRAANRPVKTLVIMGYEKWSITNIKGRIDSYFLASKPSMRQLIDIPGESFPHDYPMTTARLSKFNILTLSPIIQLLDTATSHQIVTIFSAVTNLKFLTEWSKHCDILVSLLQHPNWQCQLTNLMLIGTHLMDIYLASRLFTAINGLTALQYFALDWQGNRQVPDMTILAQLKVCVFLKDFLDPFLRSLERNAIDNEDIQVHLLSGDTESLFTLSQSLRSRIVRCEDYFFGFPGDRASILCNQFRSLTSLSITFSDPSTVAQLFSDFSQLSQLVHLKMELNFIEPSSLPQPLRPMAQLNSLRALTLKLGIFSHSQIEWLNLPWTMPHLKTIYISDFQCSSCKVRINSFYKVVENLLFLRSSPSAFDCLCSSLFNLHHGVPQKRFILSDTEQKCISIEKFLLL